MKRRSASEFDGLNGIEYFNFEEDFIEKDIRCIPMIVRFKLDKAGVKLKLDEWNRFIVDERIALATRPCNSGEETSAYRSFVYELVKNRTARVATALATEAYPDWDDMNKLPALLLNKLRQDNLHVTIRQWSQLTNLQRFALLKLCRPGHESKNFPKAMKEFNLMPLLCTHTENEEHEIVGYHKD